MGAKIQGWWDARHREVAVGYSVPVDQQRRLFPKFICWAVGHKWRIVVTNRDKAMAWQAGDRWKLPTGKRALAARYPNLIGHDAVCARCGRVWCDAYDG